MNHRMLQVKPGTKLSYHTCRLNKPFRPLMAGTSALWAMGSTIAPIIRPITAAIAALTNQVTKPVTTGTTAATEVAK